MHPQFLAAGARLFGVSVDPPARNAAMVEKLELPFPLLSDPDRSAAIGPLGVADEQDQRSISRPAMILVAPDGTEAWRFVSRDYADRLPEDEVLERIRGLGLAPTSQSPPETVDPQAGPEAVRLEALPAYFRGARYTALALGLRHGRDHEPIKVDSKAYVAEMDRYHRAVSDLLKRKK